VTAVALGSTEIMLVDANMKEKAGVKPPSAHIYVVEPDAIQFTIDRGNIWHLQRGSEYHISVRLTDPMGNSIHITDNARFDTQVPQEYFEVLHQSNNGTYFHVLAKKTGKPVLKSTFASMLTKKGHSSIVASPLSGEQTLQISDPIRLSPSIVVFPSSAKDRYETKLQVNWWRLL
jgi:hypothetical protein